MKNTILDGLNPLLTSGGSIRFGWLVLCLLSLITTVGLVLLRNHDAILIIGLHLNFKMGFITDLQQTCDQKGTAAHINRSTVQPHFPYTDNCDRSSLGDTEIIMPDPHASYAELEVQEVTGLTPGGIYNPPDCKPNPLHKIAIIIPHRHREYHLRQLLHVLHPTLQHQKISYQVFVLHQAGEGIFNKARLLNAGVKEALKQDPTINCFIMHDVDLVMENERNLYYCNPNVARHISAGIDKYNYELPYDGLFGGVVALTKDQFERINGYSNEYWGWGCEDDDMFIRVVHSCVGLEHVMHEDARFKMIYHPHDQENAINSNRFAKLIHAADRQYKDGYNNIKYKVVSVEKKENIYTNITIDVGTPEREKLEREQAVLIDDERLDSGPSPVDEEFEFSMQAICLTGLFMLYSLYKSKMVHYFFLRSNRQRRRNPRRTRYLSGNRRSGPTSGSVVSSNGRRSIRPFEQSDEDDTTDPSDSTAGGDERPLILVHKSSQKLQHNRSHSVGGLAHKSLH